MTQAPVASRSGQWFAMADAQGKQEIMRRVREQGVERYKTYVKALKDALGVGNKPPAARLEDYTLRPGYIWALLRETDPVEYQHQADDWRNLLSRQLQQQVLSGLTGPLA